MPENPPFSRLISDRRPPGNKKKYDTQAMTSEADSNRSTEQPSLHLLPCLPHVLLGLLEQADGSLDAAWKEGFANAPALAAHVLAAWQPTDKAGDAPRTIEQAVAAVGADACRSIVHHAAIRSVFGRTNGERMAALKRHWWRGVLCANIARQIAGQVAYAEPGEARLAALLLALHQPACGAHAEPDGAEDEPETCPAEQDSPDTAEPSFSHLLQGLHLPSLLVDAVKFHRERAERIAESHPLVRIVWLANAYTDHLTGTAPLSSEAAPMLFGVAPDLRLAASIAHQTTEAAAQKFGIELDTPLIPAPGTIVNERRQYRSIPTPAQGRLEELPGDILIRHRLAREVRDLAMMDGMAQSIRALTRRQDILAGCAEAARILFGLAPPLFFLPGADDTLRAQPLPGQTPGAAEFTIPSRGGRSLCAQAAARQAILDSFSSPAALVLDEQISQTLERPGVLYLPLVADGALVGLAAFGIAPPDLLRVRRQQRLLERFARFCARALRESAAAPAHAGIEADSALRGEIRRAVHEANNPLSIIKNYVKLLTARAEGDSTSSKGLRIIGEEIDRIATTLRALTSSTAAAPVLHEEAIDINGIIRDLLGLARDTLFAPARISVVTHLAETLPPVLTQRDKLKQILLNLMKNAAEAMPNGGIVTLSTRDNVNRDGQAYVEIAVSDSGPGISPEIMEHLFKPVASTKGAEHGGLGISIVGELATILNISVTCTSDANGTIFQLLVPRILAATAGQAGNRSAT